MRAAILSGLVEIIFNFIVIARNIKGPDTEDDTCDDSIDFFEAATFGWLSPTIYSTCFAPFSPIPDCSSAPIFWNFCVSSITVILWYTSQNKISIAHLVLLMMEPDNHLYYYLMSYGLLL